MQSKTSGFILVKIVIAITLLALVLSVSLQMIGASASAIRDNRQKTTATFLLQQCLEWTRNVRDSAWRQSLPWNCGFQDTLTLIGPTFSIDTDASSPPTANCSGNLGINIHPSVTPVDVPDNDNYQRLLTISDEIDFDTPADGVDKLTVTCRIEWPKNNGTNESLEMSQILTDWKKR